MSEVKIGEFKGNPRYQKGAGHNRAHRGYQKIRGGLQMKKTRCSYCGVTSKTMRHGNLCHACSIGIMEEV